MINNVFLRDVIEDDLSLFFAHQLDPDATAMAAFPSRDRNSFMAHSAKIMADDLVILKTILFDERVAGNIVSFVQSGKREVGYWIGKEYWGKGIATKAPEAFLDHVRTRPLYAHVAKHNRSSRRVLEKCGFMIVGEATFSHANGAVAEEFILKSD